MPVSLLQAAPPALQVALVTVAVAVACLLALATGRLALGLLMIPVGRAGLSPARKRAMTGPRAV